MKEVIEVLKDYAARSFQACGVDAAALGDTWLSENPGVITYEIDAWGTEEFDIPLSGLVVGILVSDEDSRLVETKKAFFKKAKSEHFTKACFVTVPSVSSDKACGAISVGISVAVLLSLDVNNLGYKSVVVNRDLTYQVYNAQKSSHSKSPQVKTLNAKRERSGSESSSEELPHQVLGEIKTFFVAKGFGFIIASDQTQTFFHINNIKDPELVEFLEASKPEEIQKRHIRVKCVRRKDVGEKYHTAVSVEPVFPTDPKN
jgi:hypothetical protein